mgnify:CR=1 FL=1
MYSIPKSSSSSRSALNLLFRYALEVGKRARTETGISKSTASVSHAAVEMAEEILGSLTGKSVLVVGAGGLPHRRAHPRAWHRFGGFRPVFQESERRHPGHVQHVSLRHPHHQLWSCLHRPVPPSLPLFGAI